MTDLCAAEAPESGRSADPAKHMQGHWLLAQLGKRVLRPGGLGLTRQLLGAAAPDAGDRIVEFGPGVGKTASALLAKNPASYVGVDPHPEGRGPLSAILDRHPQARLEIADATDVPLPDGCADLVVGEAMMSMHGHDAKTAIVREAARLLAPGGRYAIHELLRLQIGDGAADNGPIGTPKDRVAKEISRTIKVGARPLTHAGWVALLEAEGLEIMWTSCAPMHLLEPQRIIADEGVAGSLRFAANLARNKTARARVRAMRQSFRANAKQLGAIAILARKPAA